MGLGKGPLIQFRFLKVFMIVNLINIYFMRNSSILISISICFFFSRCNAPNLRTETTEVDTNRFEIELVAENLNQPMSMEILKDGRVLFVEKDGAVKVFDPNTLAVNTIAEIPVNKRFKQPYTTSGQKYDADDGMHGVVLDPDFDKNGFLYFYYSPESEDPISLLVRYTWDGDSLDMTSEKILLKWETQREMCCHWGGGMIFDQQGNLLIAIGDNSGTNINSEYGDSRRTSGNTNDLRGSILRIKPQPDGSYTIPEGNLFPEGTANTRPEIYVMGVRNPWRLSMDSKTGWLYWGEVGPSTDEFNVAREAGNFGWPFFIANNEKYLKVEPDYDTLHIINDSPYNTGLKELPSKPVAALAWYDRNPSEIFPVPGSGSLSAVGGPFFRSDDFKGAARPFPANYDGKWFVTDYVRGWILLIETDEEGKFKSMEEFMPAGTFTGINDIDFSPDGDLYVLQYGHDSYASYAKDAKLFRIKYNSGNRKPIAKAGSDKLAGATPLEVKFSSEGTVDYDDNITSYHWVVESDGREPRVYKEENPIVTIEFPGIYDAILTVTDRDGAIDRDTVEITAGNTPPAVQIEFIGGNNTFYFPGDLIEYAADIRDHEDENIDQSQINIWSDYLPVGFDLENLRSTLRSSPTYLPADAIMGQQLVSKNNCNICHNLDQRAAGPSFTEIANKYKRVANVYEHLSEKIIGGTRGAWGPVEMPAHPSISTGETKAIIDFIFNSTQGPENERSLPKNGKVKVPDDASGGYMVFKASYRDSGSGNIPSIETIEIVELRDSRIYMSDVDSVSNMRLYTPHFKQPNHFIPNDKIAFVGFKDIDLSGINRIDLDIVGIDKLVNSDWEVSIMTSSADGEAVGHSKLADLAKGDDGLVKLDINATQGRRDVYIVFESQTYDKSAYEFEVRSVKFVK